ncbi:MAG: hypothetical protein JKY49_00565 [Cohaesibacteraceae bacterium]|nr:hypothetical protein [Cohaesibacteraceae bacterium]
MMDTQLDLEEETRGLTIKRYRKLLQAGHDKDALADTDAGSFIIRQYVLPFSEGISRYTKEVMEGRGRRAAIAGPFLHNLDHDIVAFLFLKAIINKLGIYRIKKACTVTALAINGAGLIHDELRLQAFEKQHASWCKKVLGDFDARELPRHKRQEHLLKVFEKAELEWTSWTKTQMVHIGCALITIFKEVTGDIEILHVRKGPKLTRKEVHASQGLMDALGRRANRCEALYSTYMPMVVKPSPWTPETLQCGNYISVSVTPYPLVKSSKPEYQRLLRELADNGKLDDVLKGVNALGDTAWRINKRTLEVLEEVFKRSIECGKLPPSDILEIEEPKVSIEGMNRRDDPYLREYLAYRAKVHEANRRNIGKRTAAIRAIHLARRFKDFEAIYFPHDLDSRGRAYPKPSALNPQGPDYIKGLLEFSEGKPVGINGLWWLGVHGANCYGNDKIALDARAGWAYDNLEMIKSIARNPLGDLSWTRVDAPLQFLAFCFEWGEAYSLDDPTSFVSHLHIDVDATCSGLQHFSAMLRDSVGGKYVNMTISDKRMDVYEAVADVAKELIREDLGTDKDSLAKAWLKFGMDRKITKRPVMVKPYAGTHQSCSQYIADSVEERLKDGAPMPWLNDDLWNFQLYGSSAVWRAIPKVVVAADATMLWLSQLSRLVARSRLKDRVEWVSPSGFPVWQYKGNSSSYVVRTKLDGASVLLNVSKDLPELNPRKMATSVPPSFVHSLDAAHLQITLSWAVDEGITSFAAVHDSFGTHAADVEVFSQVIRDAFVWMYEEHDVLQEFHDSAIPFISEKYLKDIPKMPPRGTLELNDIRGNDFFFS